MPKRRMGGHNQQLAQLQAEKEETPQGKSKLAAQLMGSWSWGIMSAPLIQALAAAAVHDGLEHPQVAKIAKVGSSGKFPGNMQRDLMAISGDFASLHDALSTMSVRLKVKAGHSEAVNLYILLPHKIFAFLYTSAPSAFENSILGGDKGNVAKFWSAMKKHPIVTSRPDLQGPGLSKVVPIAIHGDGVNYMQAMRAGGKSMDVLSWSSLLSKGATKTTNFLIFLLVKTLAKDFGLSQTWPKLWKVLCWSLECLRSGVWPELDWDGEEFEETSVDAMKKGTPLAGGYSAFVFTLRSDLEFLAVHFKLNNAASNYPCALCKADRFMESRPWTDCRLAAQWRKTCWGATEWATEHPYCHPFFKMPGSGIDLFFPDLMHCKHLGTDLVLLGGVLTWLIKVYLKGTAAENLDLVWDFIQQWYKDSPDLYAGAQTLQKMPLLIGPTQFQKFPANL